MKKLIEVGFGDYEEEFLIYISWKLWRFFGLISLKRFRIERIGLDFNKRCPFGFMLYSFSKGRVGSNLSIQFWINI